MTADGAVPVAAGPTLPTGPVGLPEVMTLFMPLDLNDPDGAQLEVTEEFIAANTGKIISVNYGDHLAYDAEITSIEAAPDNSSLPGISVTVRRVSGSRPRTVTEPDDVGGLGGSAP